MDKTVGKGKSVQASNWRILRLAQSNFSGPGSLRLHRYRGSPASSAGKSGHFLSQDTRSKDFCLNKIFSQNILLRHMVFLNRTLLRTIASLALSTTPASSILSSTAFPAVNGPTKLVDVDDPRGRLELSDDAKTVFQQLTGPVYVVVLFGSGRFGKSTLLSLFVREWYEHFSESEIRMQRWNDFLI